MLRFQIKSSFTIWATREAHSWLWQVLLSVQFSSSVVSNQPHGLQHGRLPVHHQLLEFTQIHVHWIRDATQPSCPVSPFSSCLQSFPASGSFQMSQFFASGGQCIGVLASASVLPTNIQDWFPLGWTGWISLLSKGLSRLFSNTTVQKHQMAKILEFHLQYQSFQQIFRTDFL